MVRLLILSQNSPIPSHDKSVDNIYRLQSQRWQFSIIANLIADQISMIVESIPIHDVWSQLRIYAYYDQLNDRLELQHHLGKATII